MNSENLNISSSEISSSEEADHQKDLAQDDTAGTKRSYECTYCRRGFTNAQALGGHMNIHRKDRAKAKQVTPNHSSSLSNKFTTDDESVAFPFDSDQPLRRHSFLESRRNFDMYFHQPAPSLIIRNQPAPAPAPAHASSYHEFHNQRSWPMHLNQELRGANLSLRIGPSSHVDNNSHQIRRGTQKENEVDLELRLGHDPY